VLAFEEYLYKLVEEASVLKSDSLLFDFLSIDYTSGSYREKLKALINVSSTQEELLSLEVYEKCIKINKVNSKEEIFILLDEFYNLYLDYYDNYYELLYEFYLLHIEKDSIESGYSNQTEEELVDRIKKYAFKVLEMFYKYREQESWIKFLDEPIYIEPVKKVIKQKEVKKPIQKSQIIKWWEFWKA